MAEKNVYDAFVLKASEIVKALQDSTESPINISVSRIPHTYHHDRFRSFAQVKKPLSRSDVGSLLSEWSDKQPDPAKAKVGHLFYLASLEVVDSLLFSGKIEAPHINAMHEFLYLASEAKEMVDANSKISFADYIAEKMSQHDEAEPSNDFDFNF